MSFDFSVGDFIAVGTLAWDLHRQCYLVARDAPEEFNAIQILEEEVKDPNSTLMSAGEEMVYMKYDKLLGKKRPNWKRYVDQFKYSLELDALRSKLCYHNGVMQLLLTSAGNSSLQRLQCTTQKLESEVSEIKGFLRRLETGNLSLPVISNTVGPHDDTSFKLSLTQILMERAEVSQKWSEIGIHDWIGAACRGKNEVQGLPYGCADLGVKIRQEFERIERSALQIPGIEAVDSEYMTMREGADKDPGLHLRNRAEDQEWIATHENVYFQKHAILFRKGYHFAMALEHELLGEFVVVLAHKKKRQSRLVVYDQNWVIHAEFEPALNLNILAEFLKDCLNFPRPAV
ncbi:hypothetical protein BDD12DRAFT_801467 [Trichophaea hybrida]|nr:hypothetical protein BDD12DRAFT_801467 [Trichophaea hybrida]